MIYADHCGNCMLSDGCYMICIATNDDNSENYMNNTFHCNCPMIDQNDKKESE